MKTDYLETYRDHIHSEDILRIRRAQDERLNAKGLHKLHATCAAIPELKSPNNNFSHNAVQLGTADELSDEERNELRRHLLDLLPWRKGPFSIFGIEIDAEWRSDNKWNRVLPHLAELKGKRVCDIGANSGYYMYRMLDQDPEIVIGIDPTIRYFNQFECLQKLTADNQLYYEPFGVEHIVHYPNFFDMVFCMGILYHHPNPVGMLRDISASMVTGGQLIIETQGIPGDEPMALFPVKRYAKAPGTYFVPTAECVVNWLGRAYFENIEVFYTHDMTADEQRSTEWMPWESYKDFVDEGNKLTVEGYPAPIRFYIKATKKKPGH